MNQPSASVVVCTYNRAEMLRAALESLFGLACGGRVDYEIVVVDNASTDQTATVIAEAAARSPVPLRGVCEPRPGVACARNCGLDAARSDWIAFFDDDQLAHPDWLHELLAMAQSQGAVCVGGPCLPLLPETCPPELSGVYGRLLEQTPRRDEACRYEGRMTPGTGNLLIHRSVFQRVGRFDETLHAAGEDTDLFRRIRAAGIDAWYAPQAVVHHRITAERLATPSLLRAQRRSGWVFAHRDRQRWGRWGLLAMALARAGQVAGLRFPQMLWAGARGDRASLLVARCAVARNLGYLRGAARSLAPGLFPQHGFLGEVNFRAERERMAVLDPGKGGCV